MLTLSLMLLLAAARPDAGVADGGFADGGFDSMQPGSWVLAARLAADSGERATLIAELTAKNGDVGEVSLTRAEAEAVLDDPRAQLVYGEKTVGIVAPSMVKKQRQDHLDLMALFLKPERVAAGAAFAKEREAVLRATEEKTGVDRNVIIGILMWESKLGAITGEFRAFNVFTSQSYFIDAANQVALSRKDEKVKLDPAAQERRVNSIRTRAHTNLLALLRQCKARGIDALDVKGSWAGALGFPQFMPTSLRWADDGNGDGKIDLFDMEDSIASIGRYLAAHGFAAARDRAVWAYNHEDAYVQGVLAFADALAREADGGR